MPLTLKNNLRDFRKTDKIYRTGLEEVQDKEGKEKIEIKYKEFAQRMKERWEKERGDIRTSISIGSDEGKRKRARDPDMPTPIREKIYAVQDSNNFLIPMTMNSREKEPSYTDCHINKNKECPIFVDSGQRKEFIPEATLYINKYYLELQKYGKPEGIVSER